jgi:hypothetical protein
VRAELHGPRICGKFLTGALLSHAPQTYALDGKQYALVGVGDTLYAFTLY